MESSAHYTELKKQAQLCVRTAAAAPATHFLLSYHLPTSLWLANQPAVRQHREYTNNTHGWENNERTTHKIQPVLAHFERVLLRYLEILENFLWCEQTKVVVQEGIRNRT